MRLSPDLYLFPSLLLSGVVQEWLDDDQEASQHGRDQGSDSDGPGKIRRDHDKLYLVVILSDQLLSLLLKVTDIFHEKKFHRKKIACNLLEMKMKVYVMSQNFDEYGTRADSLNESL